MDAIEFLHALVAIESLSGDEAEATELLVERMSALGFEAHVDGAGNAVGVRRGPESAGATPREIVLLGHVDTVPGRVPLRLADGKLHGRGSVDAKGPLATFVEAVARVEPAPGVSLVVIGAVEEESATSKGARFIAPLHRPEACLIGEPSGWDALTVGYKGRLLVDYAAQQPGGHSAGPIGAVAERAADFWERVCAAADDFNAGRPRLFDRLLPSLRGIRTSSDGLTDRVEATLGFRLPLGFDSPAFEDGLRALAGDASLEFRGHEAAHTSPRTTPLARSMLRAIRRHGGDARCKHKTGTSDMNVLGPAWNCPIAAYGPGDSKLDHTPDEHLVLAEYERAIAILADGLVEAGYGRRGI